MMAKSIQPFFRLLITKKLYLKYAHENLDSEQIDVIDEKELLS